MAIKGVIRIFLMILVIIMLTVALKFFLENSSFMSAILSPSILALFIAIIFMVIMLKFMFPKRVGY